MDNYEQWYEEAIIASNELGYAGMSAADVIRVMGEELKSARQQAVPSGYVMVPVEPTREMLVAGVGVGTGVAPIYSAMLAAAPQAEHVVAKGCTKPGCFPYCDCNSIDSAPAPQAEHMLSAAPAPECAADGVGVGTIGHGVMTCAECGQPTKAGKHLCENHLYQLPAPAAHNPEHTLFNEIRISEPVNEDGEETRYLLNEQQLQRIRLLEAPAAPDVAGLVEATAIARKWLGQSEGILTREVTKMAKAIVALAAFQQEG